MIKNYFNFLERKIKRESYEIGTTNGEYVKRQVFNIVDICVTITKRQNIEQTFEYIVIETQKRVKSTIHTYGTNLCKICLFLSTHLHLIVIIDLFIIVLAGQSKKESHPKFIYLKYTHSKARFSSILQCFFFSLVVVALSFTFSYSFFPVSHLDLVSFINLK